MRTSTGLPDDAVHGTCTVVLAVASWRDGRLLAADVPVIAGRLRGDSAYTPQLYADLTVPDTWTPAGPYDPLAAYGQRLHLSQQVGHAGRTYAVPLGWYVVRDWQRDTDSGAVQVTAADVSLLVADGKLTAPRGISAAATFVSECRDLCADAGVPFRAVGLTDRPLPASISAEWVEDRAGALRDVLAAWPAVAHTDDDGTIVATPPPDTAGTPVVRWRHGHADAYVSLGHGQSRTDLHNGVVARGQTATGEDVSALVVAQTGPAAWGGPFGYRPRFYSSPVLTSRAACEAAARTMLDRELRRGYTIDVQAPPDPRLQLGDVAAVTDDAGTTSTGVIVRLDVPLTADGGAATYSVAVGDTGGA